MLIWAGGMGGFGWMHGKMNKVSRFPGGAGRDAGGFGTDSGEAARHAESGKARSVPAEQVSVVESSAEFNPKLPESPVSQMKARDKLP